MKKLIALLLALTLLVAFAGCNKTPDEESKPTETQAPTQAPTEDTVDVMSYEEFAAAAMDSEVIVEAYIQAVESWYQGVMHLYTQNDDGAYYVYSLACTEEQAAELVPGTKLRIKGFKGEWSGEVEILDATYEILDAEPKFYEAEDVTAALGTDALAEKMNKLVAFKGLTVAASTDANGNEVPFLYKWDGSGSQGDDIYFKVAMGEQVFTFTVNAYMTGTNAGSELYTAVENLKIGDKVDLEGFLYWYEGPQPHINAVTVTESAATVMSYAEYAAAEMDTEVVVEAYIQAVESWYQGVMHLYTQNDDGAYYVYSLACTEEQAAELVPGTKLRLKGFKGAWAGEVEIMDATYEILDAEPKFYEAEDVTALLGTDALAEKMNKLVSFKGLTVAPSKDANGNDVAILYKWDGSGSQGDDIYFKVAMGEQVFTFTVNAYMTGTNAGSELYTAIENLKVGDKVDLEGFLYWYEGPQPHINSVTVVG